jgi:chemotaxis-related protein WspD
MKTTDANIDDCWKRIGVWRTAAERCPELDRIIHCRNCTVFVRAGRRLLRTEPPEGYRAQCTRILAAVDETKPVNISSAFVFRVGSEWLALPARLIQEVVNMGPIHSIPNMPGKALRGLVNIHGRLHICVSIGRVLGIKKFIKAEDNADHEYTPPERLVIVLQENNPVAFPVTEIMGMVNYTPEMIKELPATVSGSKAAYTMGILHLDGNDIGLLKDKPLFKTLTQDLE